jgi:hypothetical protein
MTLLAPAPAGALYFEHPAHRHEREPPPRFVNPHPGFLSLPLTPFASLLVAFSLAVTWSVLRRKSLSYFNHDFFYDCVGLGTRRPAC